MNVQPSNQPQSRTFDAMTLLSVLAALPLAAIVVAVLLAPLRQRETPERLGAPVETKEQPATDARDTTPSAKGDAELPAADTPLPKADEQAAAEPSSAGIAPTPPWQTALDQTGEPPEFTQVAFQDFATAFDRPGRDDLTPWFGRVEGAGFRIGKIPSAHGKSGTIEGIGRLLSPWPADGVLRLQLENFNRLKIHFFHGLEGVTLVYYEDQAYRWAAYATTREPGKPAPNKWAITATDDDRCRRTELRLGGPIELRYRENELVLSRGDVVLLAAPLAGPPSDVFFEGRATIHGIGLARTINAPASPIPLSPASALASPAELAWSASSQSAAARRQTMADGSVQFTGDNLAQHAEWFTELPTTGIHEVLLELSDVAPGSGVFLGRSAGNLAEVIRFFRDRKSGQLAARLQVASNKWQDNFESPADQPTPLIAQHCWLRLLYGCGNVRWWLSADGLHWAQVEAAHDNAAPGVTGVGVQLVANCPGAALSVKKVMLRPLTGLSALAEAALVEHAPVIAADSLAAWHTAVLAQKPTGIDDYDWLRACSLRALGAGAERRLAYWLLEALLDDAAERGLSLSQQLAALDDAMLLALDLRDGQAMRVGVFSRYVQLGIREAGKSADGGRAWSMVRDHYHAAAAHTWMQLPVDLDRAIRHELVASGYRNKADETLHFLERLRFFHHDRQRPLVDWVESRVGRANGGRASELVGRMKDSWREPLVEELSKDTYNVVTELKAALDGNSWEDAARLVAQLNPESGTGIAPYPSDRALLTSLPVAVQLALEDYPQIRQALSDKYPALAKLRIAQAASAGNAPAIELASVQFAGTEAAADAHRWLGDRALVAGFFSRAMTHYQQAAANHSDPADDLMPRTRLAAAMLGRDAGHPARQDVHFGDLSLSAADFESLITEMRSRDAAETSVAMPEASPVPGPGKYEARMRSRLEEPFGERPQEETGRRTNQYRVDWADRQLAVALHGDTMYVANHFQVAAYDLSNGQRLWQSQPPPGVMQRAQEWALIPMRPLVVGNRIFVRLLYSPAPVLVCLDKSSGKLLWVSESRDREFFVSDLLWMHGQLVALGVLLQQDQTQLRHYNIDPRTGQILRHRDLVHLRSTWQTRSCCELVDVEEGLVAALGGFTIALDTAGNVRWIRRQTVLPADEDPRWVLQSYQRPLLRDGRVYLAQPGVRTVESLDAATGRLYWSAVHPEIVGLIGLTDDLLVVRTETEIRGLTLADGATRWRYAKGNVFSFPVMDEKHLLIATREPPSGQGEPSLIRLTWLSPADGKPAATTLLPGLSDSDPRLGPLVPHNDRLFTFFGRGQHDPTRDVVELAPIGEAESPGEPLNAWLPPIESSNNAP